MGFGTILDDRNIDLVVIHVGDRSGGRAPRTSARDHTLLHESFLSNSRIPDSTMAIAKYKKLVLPSHPNRPLSILPDFLIPAFQHNPPTTARPFSTSPSHASRVGAAPIALPPDVHLRLLDPPKRRGAITRVEPPKTLEVEGPLGKASVQLPPFVNYTVNDATKKAQLNVLDRKVRDQREMWGLSPIPFHLGSKRWTC